MNEMELFKRLVEIRDTVEAGWPRSGVVMIDALMRDRWGAVDGPNVCGEFEENGSCIHSDCMREAGM
jgi:hypothetical protein